MNPSKKKKLHIALYLNHLEIGGAETIFVELARGFVSLGMQVDFVLVQAHGALLSQISTARVIDLKARNAYMGLPQLIRYLHTEKPDAFLAISELTGLVAVVARFIARVRSHVAVVLATTVSRHKRTPYRKKIERILLTLLYPKADRIVAVSRGVAEDFSWYTGISIRLIKVIYSPVIKPGLYKQLHQDVEHEYFRDGKTPIVLGVGRLSEPKNFPLLIQAFALLRRQMRVRLIILGEGEERSALEHLVDSLDLHEDVSLPGFVPSPYPYMNRASVFVMSSMWEGLPGALIEAMACGAPVVSTDCQSGPREILDGGKYGHLVPVGDAQALADAIRASLNGDQRKPPVEWLEQFKSEPVIKEYLKTLGLAN